MGQFLHLKPANGRNPTCARRTLLQKEPPRFARWLNEFLKDGLHRAKMTVLALICISETSEQNMTKFKPYLTFIKMNLLMKKIWPLKARKAMMK